MMRLSLKGWGWIVLLYAGLLGVYAWYGGPTVFLLLVFATLLMCGELVFVMAGPRKIEIHRSVHRSCVLAGESTEVTVTVKFQSVVPVPWMTVTEQLNGMSYRHLLLPGWRRSFTYAYLQEKLDRGVYGYSSTEIEWGGMFGVCTGRRKVGREGRLIVMPKPIQIMESDLQQEQHLNQRNDTEGDRSSLSGPPGIELRKYLAGDPLNRIHWKSSARRGQLMFRLPEEEERLNMTLVLDRSASSYKKVSNRSAAELDQEAFEIAVSTAAGLIAYAEKLGQEVELICLGTGIDAPFPRRIDEVPMLTPEAAISFPLMLKLAAIGPAVPYPLSAELKKVLPVRTGGHNLLFITGRLHEDTIAGVREILLMGKHVHIYYTSPGPVIATSIGGMEGSGEQSTALSIVHQLSTMGASCHYVGDRTDGGQAVSKPSWKGGSSHAGSK